MDQQSVSRETPGGYLTSEEASAVTGASEATIRKWVERGYLHPVNPGKKPARYRDVDVWVCARDRLSAAQRRRLYGAWDALNEAVDSVRLSDDS